MRAKVQFPTKNSTFLVIKTFFLEKGQYQKMFGPLFFDSAYFSYAKTTFGMFGMICFKVDSQTHTLCIATATVVVFFKSCIFEAFIVMACDNVMQLCAGACRRCMVCDLK
jgi:hypothetical protein